MVFMNRKQLAVEFDGLLVRCEDLIKAYCKNNELEKQAMNIMKRSISMVKLSMYSQDSDEIIPMQLYEKEEILTDRVINHILNEIKRINNIKKFNQNEKMD